MLLLRHVSKHFAMRPVLRDVTLELRRGEITLLTGSNGAGKTTLLRLMAGLIRPDAGTLECHCHNGAVGYLGHDTFVYPGLSALENLCFWDTLMGKGFLGNLEGETPVTGTPKAVDAGVSRAHNASPTKQNNRLEAMLQRVDLQHFAHEPVRIFSRGMTQRLNLARVLLQNPDLLLLDEPGTGLDHASQDVLLREIMAAKARNACVVWISHNVQADLAHADRHVTLQRGLIHSDKAHCNKAYSDLAHSDKAITGSAAPTTEFSC